MSLATAIIDLVNGVPFVEPIVYVTVTWICLILGMDLPEATNTTGRSNSTVGSMDKHQTIYRDLSCFSAIVAFVIIMFCCSTLVSRLTRRYIVNVNLIPNVNYFSQSAFLKMIEFLSWIILFSFDEACMCYSGTLPCDCLPLLLHIGCQHYLLEWVMAFGLGWMDLASLFGNDAILTGCLVILFKLRAVRTFISVVIMNSLCLLMMEFIHTLSFLPMPPAHMARIIRFGFWIRCLDGVQLVVSGGFMLNIVLITAGDAPILTLLCGILNLAYISNRLHGVTTGQPYLLAGIVPGTHVMGI